MMFNLSTTLFSSSLILGTLISVSSSSWVIMWIGLEMNLMSFIPIMNNKLNPYESEASMKYFLVQAMASAMLMMSILLSSMMEIKEDGYALLLLIALFMKMGAAPMHMWFPNVMQGLNWVNCFILMTWQKIAPMIMMSYQMQNYLLISFVAICSAVVGAMGGLNQTSVRKIMAYSSISHLGWLMVAMMIGDKYWILYFIMYSLLNMVVLSVLQMTSTFQVSQIFSSKTSSEVKFTLFMTMMSLGGLPPFLGFLPKWMIIQNMILMKNYLLILPLVMTTLLTLYFYLRMMYSAFMLNSQSLYWSMGSFTDYKMMMFVAMSLMGIPIITFMSMF